MPYRLIKKEGAARRGEFQTVHGTVQTPAFQNVATAAAIKGGLSAHDLKEIRAQVMLCNTYHLHLRPGDQVVADMGGLHKFTRWNDPDRQRRISGVQPCQAAPHYRGRRNVQLSSGRPPHFYGAGTEHADSGKPWLHHCHGL